MKQRFLSCVLALCLLLCAAAPTVMAAEHSEIARREIAGAEYFCIRDLEAVSDISVSVQGQTVTLSEDGLEVSLSADSNYVLRGSDLVAAMAQRPVVEDGNFYASVDFLEAFLCADGAAQPSLFHGMKFRAGEVLTALYAKDKSAFDQKLLEAVLLPTSMGIDQPHINMARIYVTTPLREYSEIFTSEMKRLGIREPEQLAYGAYEVIYGAQSLASAGMSAQLDGDPDAAAFDPTVMTVAAYTSWQQAQAQKQFEAGLSAQAKAFAEKNKITYSDLSYLHRYFNGSYLEKTDAELRDALVQYYAADVGYLQGLAAPFSDVSSEDWFFEDVVTAHYMGLMNGTGGQRFSPHSATSRGMIVTILYRLEGAPAAEGSCPFTDVAAGSYYENAITWAASSGIVTGYGQQFDPEDAITREQLAAILWRYAKYKSLDVSAGEDMNILSYNDAFDVAEYAIPAVQWACGAGLLSGSSGNLMPKGNATRCQVAAILCRFCQALEA